uniref:Doublecortin domain-containing protein 2 n=1 Tax=Erpetoichthys calabaricus TaxID=27687 RepID=A0A8C4SKL2_ERPCA
MSATDRPNFLSQPVVKSVHLYRNGDPYFQGRKIVVNEKRVCNFESFLKEATSGVQASFGAVRNIYTPSEGHRVDALEELESGQHYVAAGREKFKKLDYLQIGSKKKNSIQNSNIQIKPVAHSRIVVSARFLRPIQEPCAIFLVANGDVLNMPVRLLIPRKILAQWEHILEMVTEKMRVRILGAVHSLFTFDGKHIMEAKDLENGQFYVAVGRERFKKLAYSDLLFTKPAPIRRYNGSKAASLPPLYRYENHKEGSTGGSSDASPQPPKRKGKKEQLSPAEEVGLHGKPVRVKWKLPGTCSSAGQPCWGSCYWRELLAGGFSVKWRFFSLITTLVTPNQNVFGLWEKRGAPGGNIQTPHSLLHCKTVVQPLCHLATQSSSSSSSSLLLL